MVLDIARSTPADLAISVAFLCTLHLRGTAQREVGCVSSVSPSRRTSGLFRGFAAAMIARNGRPLTVLGLGVLQPIQRGIPLVVSWSKVIVKTKEGLDDSVPFHLLAIRQGRQDKLVPVPGKPRDQPALINAEPAQVVANPVPVAQQRGLQGEFVQHGQNNSSARSSKKPFGQ